MKFRRVFVRINLLAVFLLLLFAAAVQCHIITLPPKYDPFVPPDLTEQPYWLTDVKLKILDFDANACSTTVMNAGLDGLLLPATSPSRSCHLEDTLMLRQLSASRVNTEQTRCNVAARLYMWERHVVQPAARHYFGKGVKEITHFGSYSCRTIHNSVRMSQHATANAFDISGFRLDGGKFISILKDWSKSGREAEFLREVRNGACSYFNLVLSPDYNADHANHFHVDMGYWRSCR